jgi:predicted transcriptional regulator of viral defense system
LVDDIESTLNLDRQQAWNAISDLMRRGMLFSPTRGAYVPIPPEYRSWGAVPATHFIDPLMKHLDRNYYVGLLSAAELHGVAHQRPQVFQVVTDRQLQPKDFGRVRLRFFTTRHTSDRPTLRMNAPTGTVQVATPEVTLLDLVNWQYDSGGISNVGSIAHELVENDSVDTNRLADAARSYPASISARTGWVLEEVAPGELDLSRLHAMAAKRTEVVPLSPGGPADGEIDHEWNVRINASFEPES